jgi:hypothetical protein
MKHITITKYPGSNSMRISFQVEEDNYYIGAFYLKVFPYVERTAGLLTSFLQAKAWGYIRWVPRGARQR